MARVQLIMADEDRDRFVHQARAEGMTLSAWLRAAAQERLERRMSHERFRSTADLHAFFADCDAREQAPEIEPEWAEHRAVIDASRRRGATDT